MIRDGSSAHGALMGAARPRIGLVYAGPLLALLVVTSSAYALSVQDAQDTEVQGEVAAPDIEQAGKIAATLQSDLSKLATTASVEDMEAAMLFVLSQGEYSLETMEAALDIVGAGPNATPTLKEAIANVRLALRRRFRRGTAAIPGGGGDGLGGSGFSAPVINIGGGGANYGS
jgi:hypothetical protein